MEGLYDLLTSTLNYSDVHILEYIDGTRIVSLNNEELDSIINYLNDEEIFGDTDIERIAILDPRGKDECFDIIDVLTRDDTEYLQDDVINPKVCFKEYDTPVYYFEAAESGATKRADGTQVETIIRYRCKSQCPPTEIEWYDERVELRAEV